MIRQKYDVVEILLTPRPTPELAQSEGMGGAGTSTG